MTRPHHPSPLAPDARPAEVRGRRWGRAIAAVLGACAMLCAAPRAPAAQPDAAPSRGRAAGRAHAQRAAFPGEAGAPALDREAEPAPAPFSPGLPLDRSRDSGASGWAVLRAVLVVATILGVAAAVVLRGRWRGIALPGGAGPGRAGWRRWLAPAASGHAVQMVQSTRLTARASVHVLRWRGREWLVGCTDQGVTVIDERSATEDGTSAAAGAPRDAPAPRADRIQGGEAG